MSTDISQLRTLRQFAAANPAFSVRFLHYLKDTNKDGFCDMAVVRLGKKVLLDVDGVARWVARQRHVEGGEEANASSDTIHTV